VERWTRQIMREKSTAAPPSLANPVLNIRRPTCMLNEGLSCRKNLLLLRQQQQAYLDFLSISFVLRRQTPFRHCRQLLFASHNNRNR
jgi:hypothetical protein